MSAHFVQHKGVNEWAVKVLRRFIEKLGDKKVLVRSDQEPAILALREEVEKHTHVEIVDEESKAYDSQSNGKIESVVQKVEKHFRTMKDALQTMLKFKIPEDRVSLRKIHNV